MQLTELRAMACTLSDALPIDILREEEREALAHEMHVRRFKPNAVIYHRGNPAGDAFGARTS